MEATESEQQPPNKLRPYSLKLFAIAIPLSYLVFIVTFWAIGVLPNRSPGDPSIASSFAVVSLWYALSCYVWIPLTWIATSFAIAAFGRRKR